MPSGYGVYGHGGNVQRQWGPNGVERELQPGDTDPGPPDQPVPPRQFGEVVSQWGIVGNLQAPPPTVPPLRDPPPAQLMSADPGNGQPYVPWISVDSSGNLYVYGTLIASGGSATPVWLNVKAYGATGNGKEVTNAAMNSGSTTLTSSANPFKGSDVGKNIYVYGAGAGGGVLATTIAGFNSAGSITLTAANAAGSNVTGMNAFWATDDTTAIQAAITAANAAGDSLKIIFNGDQIQQNATVYFPYGNYLVTSPLHPSPTSSHQTVRLYGDANGSRIFGGNSSIIDFQSHFNVGMVVDGLILDATGGHIFTNPNLKFSYFTNLTLIQRSGSFSIWDQTQLGGNNQLQNVYFTNIVCNILPNPNGSRTVPAFNMVCPTAASLGSQMTFREMIIQNWGNSAGLCDNTQYVFYLACTAEGTSSYATQIAFRDIWCDHTFGGIIQAQSVVGLVVDHLTIQDIYNGANSNPSNTLGNSQISIGTFGTGPSSRGIFITNYHRGNTTATGSGTDPSDITISSDTINVKIDGFMMSTTPASDTPQINLNGCAGAIIQNADPGTIILNPAPDTLVISAGNVTQGGGSVISTQAPQVNGVLAENIDVFACQATLAAPTTNNIYSLRVDVYETITVGHLWFFQAAGSGGSAGENWIGLYNSAGTQLAQAALDSTIGNNGTQKVSITAQTLTPGTYFVFLLWNASGMPTLMRAPSATGYIGGTGATLRTAVYGTGTTLPSPATLSNLTSSGQIPFWVGLAA